MFPFFPSPVNDIQSQGQQMRPPNARKQEENPAGLNNTQQISPQFHAQNRQFQNPLMQTYNPQNMIMPNPLPSLGCIPNVLNPLQTSLMNMHPQNGHPFFGQHPQNINQMPGMQFPGQICNISHVLNQIGMQQLCGQLAANNQMQNMNQFYNFPRGGNLWPQNPPQNLNQIMGFQGQYGSQNLMLPQNQIQQSAVTGQGFQDTFSPNSRVSGFVNASLSNDPSKAKPHGLGTSMGSSLGDSSTKNGDNQQNIPSGSVNPTQVRHDKNIHNGFSASRNFQRNHHGSFNRDNSQRRFQKPNHHMANGKGNNNPHRKNWDRARPQEGRERNPQFMNHGKNNPGGHRSKRSTALTYTEEEVKLWREARRKHFPSTTNIQKKQEKVNADSGEVNEDEKLRRQQLKEVLEKQIELGFEAAEVPSSYLADLGRELPHKRRKRGRGSDTWQSNKQGPRNSLPPPLPKPSLLKKLLSSEIKRDSSHLLQVFRFMTLNSFFDFWPEKPLEYPQLTCEGVDFGEGSEKTEVGDGECSESDCVTDGEEEGVCGDSVEQTEGVGRDGED